MVIHWGEFTHEVNKLGYKMHIFRGNINFVSWKIGAELEVSREFLPKKATAKQMNAILEQLKKIKEMHEK